MSDGARTLVLGMGNDIHGDDGVGIFAANKIIDRLRRSGRVRSWPSRASSEEMDVESYPDSLPSPEPGPVEQLSRQEDLARLRECLETIRPEWRRALTLRYVEDATYEDIAETTGQKKSLVGVWLHRAVRQLRECMDAAQISRPRQEAYE